MVRVSSTDCTPVLLCPASPCGAVRPMARISAPSTMGSTASMIRKLRSEAMTAMYRRHSVDSWPRVPRVRGGGGGAADLSRACAGSGPDSPAATYSAW